MPSWADPGYNSEDVAYVLEAGGVLATAAARLPHGVGTVGSLAKSSPDAMHSLTGRLGYGGVSAGERAIMRFVEAKSTFLCSSIKRI